MVDSYLTPKLKEGESVDLSLYNPHQRTNIRLYGLECKDWTPAMISEYKRSWATTSTPVVIRSKYTEALQWCRVHLFNQTFQAVKSLSRTPFVSSLGRNPILPCSRNQKPQQE